MLICNGLLKLSVLSVVLLAELGVRDISKLSEADSLNFTDPDIAQSIPGLVSVQAQSQSLIALSDGNYQFCSQPEPTDWQDGAGVCFNFNKLGENVEGYYGYPHSDRFICIRGAVDGNQVTGEALTLSWAGVWWDEVPTFAFQWDDEAHLTLEQGEMMQIADDSQNQEEWILFHRAVLNVDGFYQYSTPRMNSPSALCHFL